MPSHLAMANPSTSPHRSGMPKWLKVVTISALVVANLAVLAFIWVIRTGGNLLETADTNAEVTDVLDVASNGALNFLVVGSDSRAGLDDLTNFGAVGGARGDVVMIVRLDPETSEAEMLSIPRDLYVDIPGNGKNKINAAYAFGGPPLLVETVQENLGIEVNHYVEIDFVGFQALVDELDGIQIAFPYPARDLKSGLDVGSGSQTLDGDQALAYARSRSYQELQNGSWVSVDANDIGRTARQQEVIRAIVSELKSPSSVAEAGSLATALGQHMTIDSRLAATSVASLVWDFKGILTGEIKGATLPTRTQTINGSSVQIAVEPDAGEMLAAFRSGQSIATATIRVEVLNGNGTAGAAGEMSQQLEQLGFEVGAIGNAERSDYLETTIVVPSGTDAGDRIVEALGFGVVTVGDVDNGYDAVVIVGGDAS